MILKIPINLEEESFCGSCSSLRGKILALTKEFSSFQSNSDKRNKQFELEVVRDIILSFLPVFDSIVCAMDILDENNLETKGIGSIGSQFLKVLEKNGVQLIASDGNVEFNPNIHEAVSIGHDRTMRQNRIMKTFQYGFTYKDYVLRPAKVQVNQ